MDQPLFKRSAINPILTPDNTHEWEANKLYNPGAIFHGGKYHLFYRAVNKGDFWKSSIGYAVSDDGEHFARQDHPIMAGTGDTEKRGDEDPRITMIGDTFYMAYAAYDGVTPRLSIATSNDLLHWQKHGSALSDWTFEKGGGIYSKWDEDGNMVSKHKETEWSKSGGIFPEKIGGKFLMLFGEYRIWFASSDDGIRWQGDNTPFLGPREGDYFDNAFVEMGPPPIKLQNGWLVIYHGINKHHVYQLGFLLLDLADPRKILYRSAEPVFWPEESYELQGIVDVLPGGWKNLEKLPPEELASRLKAYKGKRSMPKVVFCCGATLANKSLRIFYGAGDSVICTAACDIDNLIRKYQDTRTQDTNKLE